MQSALYVILSDQIALERHLAGVANNVANASTAGFRAEGTTFETVWSNVGEAPVAFAGKGKTFLSRQAGSLTHTGNSLDLAVKGDAWFAVQTDAGVRYSRDGRLTMLDTGDLITVTGHALLDQGGAPIAVNPLGGEIVVTSNGAIVQDNNVIANVGLFHLDAGAEIYRSVDGTVSVAANAAVPVEDFTRVGVKQEYVENANVNPILEMVRLIDIQRQFEMGVNASGSMEDSMSRTIRDLGPAA